jgi:hypothetical protein
MLVVVGTAVVVGAPVVVVGTAVVVGAPVVVVGTAVVVGAPVVVVGAPVVVVGAAVVVVSGAVVGATDVSSGTGESLHSAFIIALAESQNEYSFVQASIHCFARHTVWYNLTGVSSTGSHSVLPFDLIQHVQWQSKPPVLAATKFMQPSATRIIATIDVRCILKCVTICSKHIHFEYLTLE